MFILIFICTLLQLSIQKVCGQCEFEWVHSADTEQCFRIDHYADFNWDTSREYCKSLGGELASFTDELEQNTILQQLKSYKSYWIGLNHRAKYGYYEWTTNEPLKFVSFANFDPKLPANMDKRCFELNKENGGQWMINNCDYDLNGLICKKPSSLWTNTTLSPPLPTSPGYIFGCKEGWKFFEDYCYQADDQLVTMSEARSICMNKTDNMGRIFTLSNEATSIMAGLLAQKVLSDSKVWLNLQVREAFLEHKRTYYWPSLEPMLFSRWDKFEPKDETCVILDINSYYWSTTSCNSMQRIICQKDSEMIRKPTESPPEPGCPGENWVSFGKNCYYLNVASQSEYSNHFYSKKMAEESCHLMNSSLLSIDNVEEQYFIQELLGDKNIRNAYIWLGLEFNNSIWINENQQPVSFYYWGDKKILTEGNCAGITTYHSYYGKWIHLKCDFPGVSGYICKKENLLYTTPGPPTPTPDNRPCLLGTNWFRVGDMCYSLFGSNSLRKNWVDASSDCIIRGGQLASIHSQDTNDKLTKLLSWPGMEYIWIGLNSIDSETEVFTWTDGSTTDYFNWLGGAPSNHLGRQNCVQFKYKNGTWMAQVCSSKRPWLCSAEPGKTLPTNIPTMPPSTQPPGESCGSGDYKPVNHDLDYCYRMEEYSTVSWQTARELCLKDGGDLFSITNQQDNDFLLGVITKSYMANLWIGLNQLSIYQGYEWSDGTPVSYINWGVGQPDNQVAEYCVIFDRDNGFWFDQHCDNRYSFFCKRPRRGFVPNTPPPPPILPGFCPPGFSSAGSKCYKLYNEQVAYRLARQNCLNMKATLASVQNPFENSAVIVLTSDLKTDEIWLGGRKATYMEKFRWEDNSRFVYANWNHGQPVGREDSCVSFLMTQSSEYQVGKWMSKPCTEEAPYVCMTHKSLTVPSPTPSPESPCPAGYDFYQDSCFKYQDSSVTWSQASTLCYSNKATLVSINDIFEQSKVHSLFGEPIPERVWIGMSRTKDSGSFQWSDDRYVTYTKWDADQPSMQDDDLCVAMQKNGTWTALDCQEKLPFVCSLKFGPPPTTEYIANGYCPSGEWQEHGTYCYYIELGDVYSNQKRFSDAEFLCTQRKAHLVSFRDRSEHKAVLEDIERITHGQKNRNAMVWTGMFKLMDGTFAYKDQTPVDFFYWGDGEPIHGKGDCVGMDIGTGRMKVRACSDSYGYICKTEKIAATTSLLVSTPAVITESKTPSSETPPNADDFLSQLFKSKRANGLIALFILLAFLVLIAICLLVAFVVKKRAGQTKIFPLFGGSVNNNANNPTSFDNVYFDRNLDQVAMEDVDLESNPSAKNKN